MNAFQTCRHTSDAVPLYLSQQLYLKPIARMKISLQLPQKTMGKSISNWEMMEKLRCMIKPEEFSILKVTKTNLEFIRFEAEIENKGRLESVIAKLDGKTMKLKEFPELMKIRACEAKLNFPTRHVWDTFFREAKDMNEMKPGERPDTIHLSNLPIKWFIPYHLSGDEDVKPSEKIFYRVFEKFGQIRRVDIPICDPYRSKMKAEVSGMQVFDFNEEHFFEGYVQFKDYVGFAKAMDAFRGMKLLHKGDGESHTVNINVDFDKTKHLSDASARRREIVRDRLVRKEIDREEKERLEKEEEENKKQSERQKEIDEKTAKERRRREREEKRKTKILATLKVKGADEINEKIAKEEKKLVKVQRKLEAIRLVEELFRRIKIKKETDLKANSGKNNNADELTRLKNSSELEVQEQREKLHRVIEGRVVLKSILAGGPRIHSHYDSSSSDSSTTTEEPRKKKWNCKSTPQNTLEPNFLSVEPMVTVGDWYGYPPSNGLYPYPALYSALRGHPSNYLPYVPRGRGVGRGAIPGTSRGISNTYGRRGRGGRFRGGNFRGGKAAVYPPELQEQYYRYFEKFLHEHDDQSRHSYSRSRSRSQSRHKGSSRRSRSRSYSRKRSRDRSRSYSRRRSRDYKSRSPSRSRSKARRFSRSKSPLRSRRKTRSRSRRTHSSRSDHSRRSRSRCTPPYRCNAKRKSTSRSRSGHRKSKEKVKSKSRSPSYRSIDSSKFISPSRLRMPRSKSWSLPRESNVNNTKRSWSKSPPKNKD